MLTRRPWLVLVAALVVEIVVFVASQHDFLPADPLWYADIAHTLMRDPAAVLSPADLHPITMRIGLTFPLALLYLMFGVSTLVSNLPTLFAALGIVGIAYAAPSTPRGKLIAVGLCVGCVPLLHQAAMLNADLPCGALMGWSVLMLTRRDRPRGTWWLAGAMAAWFAAFMTKESALWLAPVWAYAFVVDARATGVRRSAWLYAPALVVGACLGIGYLYACARVWGDPFARFKGVQEAISNVGVSQTYGPAFVRAGSSATQWLNRLTWQVPLLLWQMFGVTLGFAVISPWLVRGNQRIWLVAAATTVVLYWFGSSTFAAYMPLPIGVRMMVPGLPFILVTAALACDALLVRIAASKWRARPRGALWSRLAAAAVVIAIALPAARAIHASVARDQPETDAFAIVRGEAASGTTIVVVCAEPHCGAIGNFYLGLERPPNVTLLFANDFAATPRPQHALVRALVNVPRAISAGRLDPTHDRRATIDALVLPRLYWHKDVQLLDAGDGARLWQALQ